MSLLERASAVPNAFAHSDIERARELCADDLVLFGTDADELWSDRESFLEALEGMRQLGLSARWLEAPRSRDEWVAGVAEFAFADGTTLPVRVTLVFADGRLAHGHYSVANDIEAAG